LGLSGRGTVSSYAVGVYGRWTLDLAVAQPSIASVRMILGGRRCREIDLDENSPI